MKLYDKLAESDAIEIDGFFIRYFSLLEEDEVRELENNEDWGDVVLDACTEFPDDKTGEFNYSYTELANATFDPTSNEWNVNGDCVKLFKLEEIT